MGPVLIIVLDTKLASIANDQKKWRLIVFVFLQSIICSKNRQSKTINYPNTITLTVYCKSQPQDHQSVKQVYFSSSSACPKSHLVTFQFQK